MQTAPSLSAKFAPFPTPDRALCQARPAPIWGQMQRSNSTVGTCPLAALWPPHLGCPKRETHTMPHPVVTEEMIETYQTDGVVVVRGLFADWVAQLRAGIERNMAEPGPFASENHKEGETGRFFDDYCNWQRIPEFQDVIHNSPAAQVGAELMRSRSAQMFHDHVLVK